MTKRVLRASDRRHFGTYENSRRAILRDTGFPFTTFKKKPAVLSATAGAIQLPQPRTLRFRTLYLVQ